MKFLAVVTPLYIYQKPYSTLTMNTINPCARGAVQEVQVFGIVCDYKQVYSDNEDSYALLQYNLKKY